MLLINVFWVFDVFYSNIMLEGYSNVFTICLGRKLLDDNTAIKLAMDATEKALGDLEEDDQRPKRDTNQDDDVEARLDVLKQKADRITTMKENVSKMMSQFKNRLSKVREQITDIKTGIAFEQGSYLELQVPDDIKECAINTNVNVYFNATRTLGRYLQRSSFNF